MIPNMVIVGNGKGGVYKSGITANVGGLAAASGWKVLLVDMDDQGHVAPLLGARDRSDHGAGLAAAMLSGADPVVLRDVRPNLDVIPNGPAGSGIVAGLGQIMASGNLQQGLAALERVIAPLAGDYNLVLVDTPPGERVLQQAVFFAGHYIVVPTQVDLLSQEGIDRVCRDILDVSTFNPAIELLGVVAVGLDRGSSTMAKTVRRQLETAVDGLAPVFESMIHHVKKADTDSRAEGLLFHEYEAAATEEKKRFPSIADRIAARREGNVRDYSRGASGLAEDYEMLTNELLAAYSKAMAATPAAAEVGR